MPIGSSDRCIVSVSYLELVDVTYFLSNKVREILAEMSEGVHDCTFPFRNSSHTIQERAYKAEYIELFLLAVHHNLLTFTCFRETTFILQLSKHMYCSVMKPSHSHTRTFMDWPL